MGKTKEPVNVRVEGNNSSAPTAHTPTLSRRMRATGSLVIISFGSPFRKMFRKGKARRLMYERGRYSCFECMLWTTIKIFSRILSGIGSRGSLCMPDFMNTGISFIYGCSIYFQRCATIYVKPKCTTMNCEIYYVVEI